MNEIRYAIRMTTAKGDFWWTGSMSDLDDAGHGKFRTYGWSENCRRACTYAKKGDAKKKAQSLADSLRRMFELGIQVDAVQWSMVWGWRMAAEEVSA